MVIIITYIILGVVAGIFSGFLGIGGATVIIPVLIYFYGFTQHQAQGTTLALMVPPIGLLAAMSYYYKGNVNLKVAAFICIGFFIGGLIGATAVQPISEPVLRKIFGFFMLIIAIKMISGR
ncbi:MAG: sulfite exporter TauE/SafE family protein [bacterium]